jgi:hypothetical protein
MAVGAWEAAVLRERESLFGREVRMSVRDPAGVGCGAEVRASPALPTCEARIELLYQAGLRTFFRTR